MHEDGKTSIDAPHPGSPSSSNYHSSGSSASQQRGGRKTRGLHTMLFSPDIEFAGSTGTTPITFHLSSYLAQFMSYVRLQSKKLNVFHPYTTAFYTLMLILWKRDFHYREKQRKKKDCPMFLRPVKPGFWATHFTFAFIAFFFRPIHFFRYRHHHHHREISKSKSVLTCR